MCYSQKKNQKYTLVGVDMVERPEDGPVASKHEIQA